ncbi:MAG: alpha-galactosidase [Coprococcus sp.]
MINYYEKEQLFKIDTPNSSYVMAVADGFLGHVYYGKRLSDYNIGYLLRTEDSPFVPSVNRRDKVSFLDAFPMEYSFGGTGDFRETCLDVINANGQKNTELVFDSYRIYKGKQALEGLPATWGEDCESLDIVLKDFSNKLEVVLTYSVFEGIDAVTKSVKIRNCSNSPVVLEKVMSTAIDVEDTGFEIMTMHGSWARENHIQRRDIGYGTYFVDSRRGMSSHQNHPFMALVSKNADQRQGEVYAYNMVYSGSFLCSAEKNQFDHIRMVMGIHPGDFSWELRPEEIFQSPEAVLVYSADGIGAMTRTFHDLYRTHLIRSRWKDRVRPVLINNWEATYFDFNIDKLIQIVKEAAANNIEMFVLDDGWFGHRDSDNSSLGDWFVDKRKLPGGLEQLSKEVKKAGMKFGLWFEPEMISEDSKLYQEHPEWVICTSGKEPSQAREQLVLDFSRQDVVDYLFEKMSEIIRTAQLDYIKWDMNRPLTDLGSNILPANRQGELLHRYMLGVYSLQEKITSEFPELLLENCSSGGGRFDPGMLYYSPQIWCSDDTDAIERLVIQEGTLMLYPSSVMGAHVSICPNHITGRNVPFSTRANVAEAGTFGYELDITKLDEEEKSQIPEQIANHKKYYEVTAYGDYYRLASYRENGKYDAYMMVSKDKTKAYLTFVQVRSVPNSKRYRIKLDGLDSNKRYRIGDMVYAGDTLMYAGMLMPSLYGDSASVILEITQEV